MSKDLDKLSREINQLSKIIKDYTIRSSKDISDIKKTLKIMERRVLDIANKVQEFEIIMDAADIIEEQIETEENKYNTDWSPYDDEDFHGEYYSDDDDDGY
jgi:hypothetical protein|tara:strand:- start:37 stop:339 length:303 start_codon:yes stop_codon:yes gene_type:complete